MRPWPAARLWTSHYRFLNDTSEFLHGWKIVLDAIDRRGAEIRDISSLAWETVALFRQHSSEIHGFVGSLTSEGDLLSQWRGYNRGQGFSIGFSADWLLQNAAAQDFDITPVLYDTEQQRAAADRAVTLLIGRLVEGTDEPEGARAQVRTWWPHALKTALSQEPTLPRGAGGAPDLGWSVLAWRPEDTCLISRTCSLPGLSVRQSRHQQCCSSSQ
ncbi:hypothetical protein ACVWXM_009751 [Bradyrhizobium sp. GM7.3]